MTSLIRYNGHHTRRGLPLRFLEPIPHGGPHVHETDEDVTVTMDLPGVEADDVEITLENGLLKIVGRRGSRRYTGMVSVGTQLDADRIESDLKHGVLTITAPKLASAKPRRISVKGKLEASSRRSWRDLLRKK